MQTMWQGDQGGSLRRAIVEALLELHPRKLPQRASTKAFRYVRHTRIIAMLA
jgi:hypothetical protein